MAVKNMKRGAPIIGLIVLAVLLALPLVIQDPCIRVVDVYTADRLALPVVQPCIGMQFADADTLGGSNTVLAAPVLKVSEMKLTSFNYARSQMSAVYGDTSGVKLVVPGMSAGDVITGVIYLGEHTVIAGGGGDKTHDMTDSTWYHRDTIQIGAYTDSGTVLVIFNDVN